MTLTFELDLHSVKMNNAVVNHTAPAQCTPITPVLPVWNYPFCSERVTTHCQWEGNAQNCPFPLEFRHPAGGGPSHGHRQNAKKWYSIARVAPVICWRTDRQTDRQTHTHRRADHNTSPPLPRGSTDAQDIGRFTKKLLYGHTAR